VEEQLGLVLFQRFWTKFLVILVLILLGE